MEEGININSDSEDIARVVLMGLRRSQLPSAGRDVNLHEDRLGVGEGVAAGSRSKGSFCKWNPMYSSII